MCQYENHWFIGKWGGGWKWRAENKNVYVTGYEGRRKVEILKNILYEEWLSQGTCWEVTTFYKGLCWNPHLGFTPLLSKVTEGKKKKKILNKKSGKETLANLSHTMFN